MAAADCQVTSVVEVTVTCKLVSLQACKVVDLTAAGIPGAGHDAKSAFQRAGRGPPRWCLAGQLRDLGVRGEWRVTSGTGHPVVCVTCPAPGFSQRR